MLQKTRGKDVPNLQGVVTYTQIYSLEIRDVDQSYLYPLLPDTSTLPIGSSVCADVRLSW